MGSLAGNPTAGDFVGQRNHPMGDPEMRKLYLMLPVGFVLALSACQTPEQTTMAGAAAGAVIGATVADGDDALQGAVIGGIAGAAAGALIGRTSTGRCVYRRSDGSRYVAAC
jgi:Glycine zipper 2TM domain